MPFADVARRLRHAAAVEQLDPVWRLVRPVYHAGMRLRSRFGGIPRSVNGQVYRLRFPQSEVDSSYERSVFVALDEALFPGATFFDIGASYGLYTLAGARAVGASGRVFSFEPSAEAVRRLDDHLDLNQLGDRVEIIRAAVSDSAGTISFFEQDGYGTLARAITETGQKYLGGKMRDVEVDSITLDDFCDSRRLHPDVLKIDVDGAEGKALRGATSFLRARRGLILLEMHPWAIQQLGDDEAELLAWLGDNGWSARLLTFDHNTNHYLCTPKA